MSIELVTLNDGNYDEFTYGVELIKSTTGKSYSLLTLATEINVWESLFTKAMQMKVFCADAAGFMDQVAIQPNDKIHVVLMKTSNLPKVEKTFTVVSVTNVHRIQDSQGRTYVINALSDPAVLNKNTVVNKAMKGKISAMVSTIAKDYLKIKEVVVEESSSEKKNMIMPASTAFKTIELLAEHAVSTTGTVNNSFYLFYESADGYRFKTVKKIIADANTHKYAITTTNNRTQNGTDIWRITHVQQNKIGSTLGQLDGGMVENEIMQFNVLERSIASTKFSFKDKVKDIQLLGGGPFLDVTNNLPPITQESVSFKGAISKLHIRSNEESYQETNSYGEKHSALLAQKAMFNQLSYTFQFLGNPQMRSGDLIDVDAMEMSAKEQKEQDPYLHGKFLIGNIRHIFSPNAQYITVIDVFKDGMELPYEPKK